MVECSRCKILYKRLVAQAEAVGFAIGTLEGIQTLEHGRNSDTYQAAGMALEKLRAAATTEQE